MSVAVECISKVLTLRIIRKGVCKGIGSVILYIGR